VVVAIGLGLSFVGGEAFTRARLGFALLPLVAQGAAFATVLVALDALGPRGIAPFIYFQF
jgi:hypothetical protein